MKRNWIKCINNRGKEFSYWNIHTITTFTKKSGAIKILYKPHVTKNVSSTIDKKMYPKKNLYKNNSCFLSNKTNLFSDRDITNEWHTDRICFLTKILQKYIHLNINKENDPKKVRKEKMSLRQNSNKAP